MRVTDRTGPTKRFSWFAGLILAMSVVVPLLLFGWMAWTDRRDGIAEAERSAQRTLSTLHEHALRAFETDEALLNHIVRQLAGRGWDDIERDARLQRELRDLVRDLENVASIRLVDAEGRLRLSSRQFPTPDVSFADEDSFQALRAGKTDLVIGAQGVSPVSGERLFTLNIARPGAEGAFDGMASIAVSLEYFTSFWERFAPSVAHVIPLVRDDGELLVRYPALESPQRLSPNGPFMQQIRRASRGTYTAVSRIDGIERLNAYTKVGPYPVYVSFSVETDALHAAWRKAVMRYAGFALLAMLALLAMSLMLIRYTRRERAAADKWRRTADDLQQEMARRLAAEAGLRQAQKMEIIGQITGGVAHDFNNLLQSMSNNLHLAERAAAGAPQAARHIHGALEAVERGARLTRQLLSFSRREPLEPKAVDTAELVQNMAGLLRTTLGATAQIRLECSPGTWPAMTDRNQAEMAILNLAVNARDAMPEGGAVTISTGNLAVDEKASGALGLAPGEYVCVSVCDTGVGMPAEVAERAFEPFFTTKDAGKGSGLGLSQVHRFAAQSGGAVRLETAPGRGTTVQLYLPRASQPASVRLTTP